MSKRNIFIQSFSFLSLIFIDISNVSVNCDCEYSHVVEFLWVQLQGSSSKISSEKIIKTMDLKGQTMTSSVLAEHGD